MTLTARDDNDNDVCMYVKFSFIFPLFWIASAARLSKSVESDLTVKSNRVFCTKDFLDDERVRAGIIIGFVCVQRPNQ